jgi:hypothetical protein
MRTGAVLMAPQGSAPRYRQAVPARPLPRCATLVVVLGALLTGAVAAWAQTTVRVTAITLTRVNQETRQVAPGARVATCQAIPYTELAPHVRWAGAPRDGLRAVVELSVPGHRDRPLRRTLRSTARSGVRRVVFTPAALDDAAFPEGLYVVRVRIGGRVRSRVELRFTAPVASAC